jgi:TRAP-type transport system periplasmic protein
MPAVRRNLVQFRAAQVKAGFDTQWQKTHGAEAWAQPEKYTGPLI